MKLETEDIQLIVRLLHQELEAIQTIIKNIQGHRNDNYDEWCDRADHVEDLIIKFLR